MYSPVVLLSGIDPLHSMHSLLVTINYMLMIYLKVNHHHTPVYQQPQQQQPQPYSRNYCLVKMLAFVGSKGTCY